MRIIQLTLITLCVPAMVSMNTQQAPYQSMIGTWEYHTGSETFRLILQNESKYKMPDGKFYNVILGKHSYYYNGKLIEQSLTMPGQDGNPGFTLFSMPNNDKTLKLSFKDLSRNKLGQVRLNLVPGSTTRLHWTLSMPSETVSVNKPTPTGFSVPTDLVLERIN